VSANISKGLEDREAGSAARLHEEGCVAGAIGVWRWEPDSGRLQWSEQLEAIHRLPPGSFDGTFESFSKDIHPDDRDRVLGEIGEALATSHAYRVQYRLPPDDSGETHWLEARGRVMRDAAGAPIAMTGICQDVTAQKQAERELKLRARQHEAVVALGEMALAGASLQEVLDRSVSIAAELSEADFAEIVELSPDRSTLTLRASHGWQEGIAAVPKAQEAMDQLAGFAIRAGEPVVFENVENAGFKLHEAAHAHGARAGAAVTIGGRDGKLFGVLAVYCRRLRCISSTDIRFLQSIANTLGSAVHAWSDHERKELLIGELRHRVGNLFSLVQALHRQTGQNAHDARDLEMKFGARLAALASAHALILDGGWHATSLHQLLKTTLAPYIGRVEMSGCEVDIPADAAFSFSMALHELATNASKYGALSNENGRLEVTCRRLAPGRFELVWNESDGPPAPEREQEGFGTKLIQQVVERQLGGKVERVLERDGLRLRMEIPL
jgi:two-component sensor histidine kinase